MSDTQVASSSWYLPPPGAPGDILISLRKLTPLLSCSSPYDEKADLCCQDLKK